MFIIIIMVQMWQKNRFYSAWVCVTIKMMMMVMVGVYVHGFRMGIYKAHLKLITHTKNLNEPEITWLGLHSPCEINAATFAVLKRQHISLMFQ